MSLLLQRTSCTPAPDRSPKNEHAPCALLVPSPAPASIKNIKQPTGEKNNSGQNVRYLSAIYSRIQQDEYSDQCRKHVTIPLMYRNLTPVPPTIGDSKVHPCMVGATLAVALRGLAAALAGYRFQIFRNVSVTKVW